MANPQLALLPTRSYWSTLEDIPGTAAVAEIWRRRLEDHFQSFSTFLVALSVQAQSVPCPRHCGCAHQVSYARDGSMRGLCRCKGWGCADLKLTPEDITIWALCWQKLARALCQAFGFSSKFENFGPTGTVQIGTWSADAVPVFLTIQWDAQQFRHVVASLVALQKKPFILLAPTSAYVDATSQSYLTSVGAEFFPLETHLILSDHGTFQPTRLPGEIFVRFTPQPKAPLEEDVARTAYALLEQLDANGPPKPPTILTVLRLYGKEEMSAKKIARQCHCSKATVVRRLKLICAKTGMKPAELRRLSPHFNKIEDDISDSRARSIYRKSLAGGEERSDGSRED